MSTRFFTNDNNNTLLKKFEGIFAHNPDLACLDAVVGYVRPDFHSCIMLSVDESINQGIQ